MKLTNAASFRQLGHRLAQYVVHAELVILLLVAPALLFPSPRLILFTLILPALWLCAWHVDGHLIPRTPLDGIILLFLAMVLVSEFATFDINVSLSKITGILLGVTAYYAVVRAMRTPQRLRLALGLFILAGAGLSMAGLLGTNWANKTPALNALVSRLPATIRGLPGAEEGFQPNAVGGTLLLFIPLQMSLLAATLASGLKRPHVGLAQDIRVRWLLVAVQAGLLGMTGFILILTQSRGAWVGLAVAVAGWLAWQGRGGRRLLGLGLIIGLLVVVWLGPQTAANALLNQIGAGLGQDVAGREEIWSRAVFAIQSAPLTGLGFNVFRQVISVFYPAFLIAPGTDIAHAHNHLLQAAVDLGIPGLIAYLALWLGAGAALTVARRRLSTPDLRAAADGMAAGLIAFFIFGLTDTISLGSKVGLFFWLALALVTSLYQLQREA